MRSTAWATNMDVPAKAAAQKPMGIGMSLGPSRRARAPVEVIFPVADQFLHVAEVGADVPLRVGNRVRPAYSRELSVEVIEDRRRSIAPV